MLYHTLLKVYGQKPDTTLAVKIILRLLTHQNYKQEFIIFSIKN